VVMMTPERLFHELLGLGNEWEVVRCWFDEGEGVVLEVRERPGLWEKVRSEAGARAGCHDHVEMMEWRHLNVFEHRCTIRCRLPRGKCSKTGSVFRVTPPWEGLSKHFTCAFEAMALLLMRDMAMSRVAEAVGETDTRLWRMLHAYVRREYPRLDFSNVTCVGCDEMSVRRGHRYVTVFCDMIGKRVLFACEGKDAATWDAFASELGQHNGHPKAITQASVDMSAAYVKGVRENCANATVVFDKFHVVALANKALGAVRKREAAADSALARALLPGSQWLWRKNPENWNDADWQRYETIQPQLAYLHTGQAYDIRLSLQHLYATAKDAPEALRGLKRLIARGRKLVEAARGGILAPLGTLLDTLEKLSPGIAAHWTHRLTNAFLEGLNSVWSAVKRRARGYRNTANLITMLYFTHARLPAPTPNRLHPHYDPALSH